MVVDHEVVAEDFESVLLFVGVELVAFHTLEGHLDDRHYLLPQHLVKVNFDAVLFFQQLAASREAQLVSFFEFAVVLSLLLHCVVGQVDHWLVDAFLSQTELVRTGANIAFLEQIALLVAILGEIDHNPQSDVELAFIDEQWSFDVLLNHKHFRLHVCS